MSNIKIQCPVCGAVANYSAYTVKAATNCKNCGKEIIIYPDMKKISLTEFYDYDGKRLR